MTTSINAWAGQLSHGSILINGKPTEVTVENGTLEVAPWLESGQPLTADQSNYLDRSYHVGDDNNVIIGQNRHIAGTNLYEVQSVRSGSPIPALTITYREHPETGTSVGIETMIARVKALNASGQNFDLLEAYGGSPQRRKG